MRRRFLVLVSILLAGCAQQSLERRYINLPGRPVQAPFSDGVMVGNTLYLAGRLGLEPQTGRPPADASAEARLLLEGFRAVLAEAGMTMSDIVSVQVFCPMLPSSTRGTRSIARSFPSPILRAHSSDRGRCSSARASRCWPSQ